MEVIYFLVSLLVPLDQAMAEFECYSCASTVLKASWKSFVNPPLLFTDNCAAETDFEYLAIPKIRCNSKCVKQQFVYRYQPVQWSTTTPHYPWQDTRQRKSYPTQKTSRQTRQIQKLHREKRQIQPYSYNSAVVRGCMDKLFGLNIKISNACYEGEAYQQSSLTCFCDTSFCNAGNNKAQCVLVILVLFLISLL